MASCLKRVKFYSHPHSFTPYAIKSNWSQSGRWNENIIGLQITVCAIWKFVNSIVWLRSNIKDCNADYHIKWVLIEFWWTAREVTRITPWATSLRAGGFLRADLRGKEEETTQREPPRSYLRSLWARVHRWATRDRRGTFHPWKMAGVAQSKCLFVTHMPTCSWWFLSSVLRLKTSFTSVTLIPPHPPLTIARDERSVVSALLVQFAVLWGGFAGGRLHKEVVFAESALPSCGGIQWLALLLEGAPGLLSVSLTFAGQEGGGAVFGVSGWECPKVARLVLPTLRCRRAIIWIHGCHIAVWNAGLGVHA